MSENTTTLDLRERPRSIMRLTVVEQLYLQLRDGDPRNYGTPYSRHIKQEEEVYSRKVVVEQEWVRLTPEWIESCSLLRIENQEASTSRLPPNVASKFSPDDKVLEVSLIGNPKCCCLVRPGESMRVEPASIESIHVRSRGGKVRLLYLFFPS